MTAKSETTLKANQTVHSALAVSGEYTKSPHFRAENKKLVRSVLQGLKARLGSEGPKSLLDMGCGTGFIINLSHDLFDTVHGVDITDEMMALVDLSPGNITLHKSVAESTPFEDLSFDMVSAYSFLDHLYSYEAVLEEAYRVLKKGGIFYADLNPNRHFATNLMPLEGSEAVKSVPVVEREILGMLHNGEYYESNFGIDSQVLDDAEPVKSGQRGFDPDEVVDFARKLGFSNAEYHYEWYLGQAIWMHEQPQDHAQIVENYLRATLPATRAMFKYIRFVLTK